MPPNKATPENFQRSANLEEWFQLLSSNGEETPSEPEKQEKEETGSLQIEPPQESCSEREEIRETLELEEGREAPPHERHALREEVEFLKSVLLREFGDTLTGFNALTGPIGLALLVLGIAGWLTMPLLTFLGTINANIKVTLTLLGSSTVLCLMGLHFLIYWGFHRASNQVKSRELDHVIELRRIKAPCVNLDCREAKEHEKKANSSPVDSDLIWHCNFFNLDLEGLPLCAACERYEPAEEKGDSSEEPI